MNDVSAITPQIYLSSYIDQSSMDFLREQDFQLIISMIGPTLPEEDFLDTGCKLLFLKTQDNFLFPIPIKKLLVGVETALPTLEKGHKIFIYCQQGKRRSVTMTASILIAQGYSAVDAMKLIKEKRHLADPYRWYVKRKILAFEKFWSQRKLNV